MAKTADMKQIVDHIVNGTLAQNLCRICLRPLDEAAECISTKICKEDFEYSLADVLMTICEIELSEADQYNACTSCFLMATTAYKFYLLSKQSDDILNFYVDELTSNLDSVDVPHSVVSESLCIPLPMLQPVEEHYRCNNQDLVSKLEAKRTVKIFEQGKLKPATKYESEIKKLPPVTSVNLKKEPKPRITKPIIIENNNKLFPSAIKKEITIKKEQSDSDEDDDIVVIKEGDSIPKFYKILDNGSMKELDPTTSAVYHKQFQSQEWKKRKVREEMLVKDCWICSAKFRFTAKLKAHMKEIHDLSLFVCSVCKQFFTDENVFISHLSDHPNVYRCDLCGSVLRHKSSMVKHMLNHEKEMKIKRKNYHICEKCGAVLKDASSLSEHHKKKHYKQFTCYYCGRMYKSEISFDSHIKKHENFLIKSEGKEKSESKKRIGEYMCATCGRRFVDERALLWHTRLHTNERPFKCHECGRGFISNNRRNQHSLTAHTAPTKQCPLCPALFHLRSMVNTHIRKVHLRKNKRCSRPTKRQNVFWRTEPVPVRDLSIALQNQILELQEKARGREEDSVSLKVTNGESCDDDVLRIDLKR